MVMLPAHPESMKVLWQTAMLLFIVNMCSEQTALARQDLSCRYLAHHELESVIIIIIIIVVNLCPSC